MAFTIDTARAEDAAALASLKRFATASAATAHEPSPVDVNRYAVLIAEPTALVLRAQANGDTIGFLAMRRDAHAAVASRNPAQLWQIYVAPAYHGSGVASRLIGTAIDRMFERGHDVVWLGVSEGNARAISFYRKHGFQPVGVHAVGAGEHAHPDLVMARALA